MADSNDVKYGEVVALFGPDDGGYMLGDTVTRGVFLDSEEYSQCPVHRVGSCLFVIVQKFQYSAAKAFQKKLRSDDFAQMKLTAETWKQKLQPTDWMYKELQSDEVKMKDERETNEMELRRKTGYPVVYGSVVQLKHAVSQRFVTQSKNRAEHDPLGMDISLAKDGSDGSWWKIMPAEKVRTEGERVRLGDKIYFSHVKFQGSNLQVSNGPKGPVVLRAGESKHLYMRLHPSVRARYEVNGSRAFSRLQIKPFMPPPDVTQERMEVTGTEKSYLSGLSGVIFVHRQNDTVLCGNAEFGTATWTPRAECSNEQHLIDPKGIWLIKKSKIENGGTQIEGKDDKLVIQHVLSGRYLASSDDGYASLSSELWEKNVCWSLQSYSGSEDGAGSIAHGDVAWIIQDSKTGKDDSAAGEVIWLSDISAEPDHACVQGVLRQGSEADNIDVIELRACPKGRLLTIENVRSAVESINAIYTHLASLEPIQEGLGEEEAEEALMRHPIRESVRLAMPVFEESMRRLINPLTSAPGSMEHDDPATRRGPANKEHQELLKEMGALPMIIDMISLIDKLRVPLPKLSATSPVIHRFFKLCYLCVERSCTDNTGNKLLMEKNLGLFMRHLRGNMGAYFAIWTVYKDTKSIVESFSESNFSMYTEILRKSRSSRVLSFLAVLLVCDGEPVTPNQNYFVRMVLGNMGEILQGMEVRDDDIILRTDVPVVTETQPGFSATPWKDGLSVKQTIPKGEDRLLEVDVNDMPHDVAQLDFHLKMMDLVELACRGRNVNAIGVLEPMKEKLGIKYEQLLKIMRMDDMTFAIRSRACNLIQSMYIDCDPYQPVSLLNLTRVWTSVLPPDSNDELKHIMGGDALPELKTCLVDILSRRKQTNVPDVMENKLTMNLVNIIDSLTKFGFYHQFDVKHRGTRANFPEIRKVVDPLLGILDGRTDYCPTQAGVSTFFSRFEVNDQTMVVMDLKIAVLQVFNNFFACAQNERIDRFAMFWTEVLEKKFAMTSFEVVESMMSHLKFDGIGGDAYQDDSQRPPPAGIPSLNRRKSILKLARRASIESMNALLGGVGLAKNQVAPEPMQLFQYYMDNNKNWEKHPPWSKDDIENLAQQLFGEAFLHDQFSVQGNANMFVRGNEWLMPDWIKILLDLVNYKHAPLKEIAISYIIATFSQNTNFINIVQKVQLVWVPHMSKVYFDVRSELIQMRMLVNALVRKRTTSAVTCSAYLEILRNWIRLVTVADLSTKLEIAEIQRIMADFGTHTVVFQLLASGLVMEEERSPLGFLVAKEPTMLRMFEDSLAFLKLLCHENTNVQDRFVEHSRLLFGLVEVDGLSASDLLSAIAINNENIVSNHGQEWIRFYFHEINTFGPVSASWLRILGTLVKCNGKAKRDNQVLVMNLLQKSNVSSSTFVESEEGWDERIKLMQGGLEGDTNKLVFHLEAVKLLTICSEGKNPASEVYAASHISFQTVMRTLICLNVDSKGQTWDIPMSVAVQMRQTYVAFLHQVYINTGVPRLLADVTLNGNGMWTFDPANKMWDGCYTPFMESLHDQVKCYSKVLIEYIQMCVSIQAENTDLLTTKDDGPHVQADSNGTNGGARATYEAPPVPNHFDCEIDKRMQDVLEHELCVLDKSLGSNHRLDGAIGKDSAGMLIHSLTYYMMQAVFPMLAAYYGNPYVSIKGSTPDDVRLSECIFDLMDQIYRSRPPREFQTIVVDGQLIDCAATVYHMLHTMATKAKIRKEWENINTNHAYKIQPSPREFAFQKGSETVWFGYNTLVKTMARHFGILDTRLLIGTGIRQMAMLFFREGEVPLYDAYDFTSKGRPIPKNPHYYEFIMAILDISRAATTSPKVLTNILQVMRASIYMLDPNDVGKSLEETEADWNAFLHNDPPRTEYTKLSRAADERNRVYMLRWVQDKYDAMGCTSAALRLVSHKDKDVQSNSCALLITLLQGCNRRVQGTILNYFYQAKENDVDFYRSIRDVIAESMDSLKNFKKTIKGIRNSKWPASSKGKGVNDVFEGVSLERKFGYTEGPSRADGKFSRDSRIMQVLRLIQLMCKRSFKPLQNRLLRQQQGRSSINIVKALVDLIEMLQPMLLDSLWLNDGDLIILAIQIADAISEIVQGPNRACQKAILSSNFLAIVNRIFSSVAYSPLPVAASGIPIQQHIADTNASANDLKCWLKLSLLKCCSNMLEGCDTGEPHFPVQMVEFFELRNMVSQMVSDAKLLELVEQNEKTRDVFASEAGGSEFNSSASGGINASSMNMSSMIMSSSNMHSSDISSSADGNSTSPSKALRWSRKKRKHEIPLGDKYGFSPGYEKSLQDEMFAYYTLLLKFADHDPKGKVRERLNLLENDHPRLFKHLEQHTSHVEIAREQENGGVLVEKVYFRAQQRIVEMIRNRDFKRRGEEEMFDVPRDNPQEKAREWQKRLKSVLYRLTWLTSEQVSGEFAKTYIIKNRDYFDVAPLYMSVAITIFLLLCYGIPVDPNTGDAFGGGKYYPSGQVESGYQDSPYPFASSTTDPLDRGLTYGKTLHMVDLSLKYRISLQSRWMSNAEWEFWPTGRIICMALAFLHTFFVILSTSMYLWQDLPLFIRGAFDQHSRNARERARVRGGKLGQASSNEMKRDDLVDEAMIRRQNVVKGKRYLENMPPLPGKQRRSHDMELLVLLLRVLQRAMYRAVMAIMSILGFVSSPFFYVFYMLDFFARRDGRLVMQAILLGGPNLLRSFTLGLIVIVCFGFYTYAYFSQSVIVAQELCHSPFQCVSKHILDSLTGDLTTVLGDDFGNFAYPATVFWADSWNSFKSVFVVVSIIFWVFLLQGIIQGQIIDAFAEMRNASNAASEDLEQKCFVSSIDRFVFNSFPGEWDKRGGGQYAWSYLLFMTYLLDKDQDDFNGLEGFVYRCFQRDDISFIPIEKFIARQQQEMQNKTEENLAVLQRVSARVDQVDEHLSDIKDAADKILTAVVNSGIVGSADAPVKSIVAPKSMSEHKARRGSQRSPVMGGMKSTASSSVEGMLKSPVQRPFPAPGSDGGGSPMLRKDITFRNLHQDSPQGSPMTVQSDALPPDGGVQSLSTPPAVDLTSPRPLAGGGGARDDLIGGTDLASPRGGADGQ